MKTTVRYLDNDQNSIIKMSRNAGQGGRKRHTPILLGMNISGTATVENGKEVP